MNSLKSVLAWIFTIMFICMIIGMYDVFSAVHDTISPIQGSQALAAKPL